MQVRRSGPSRRAVFFVAFLGLAALIVVATFGMAAGAPAPRSDPAVKENKSLGEKYASNVANDCWTHHKGEGMRDSHVIYPIIPSMIQVGKEQEITVQIINPWKQKLQEMSMEVVLTGDSRILSVQGGASGPKKINQDIKQEWREEFGPVNGPTSALPGAGPYHREYNLTIPSGAVGLISYIEIYPDPASGTTATNRDAFEVFWKFREGGTKMAYTANGTPAASTYDHRYVLKKSLITPIQGSGLSYIDVLHREGTSQRATVLINATVIMQGGAAGTSYTIEIPPDAVIDKGQPPLDVKFRVLPFTKGTQALDIKVRAGVYYKHQDGVTPSIDHFNRISRLDDTEDLVTSSSIVVRRAIVVGDAFVPSAFGAASASVAQDQWQLVLGETSGFAAAGLLLPSLLLGGTYGKASRKFFNTILGGAKRRVMFHNIVSLALSLVAFTHIILFMYEVRYTILMGVMWGGLAALSLMVLGLTGYYQVPLIQRHGYKWWRYTHLAFGLLVVVFLGYHMIADGPDFFFMKEQFPKWINDINLSQK